MGAMTTTTPSSDTPNDQLRATAVEAIDELLRGGFGLDELCNQIGVSGLDALRALVGGDAVERWTTT